MININSNGYGFGLPIPYLVAYLTLAPLLTAVGLGQLGGVEEAGDGPMGGGA